MKLHCTYCGAPHTAEGWPKHCAGCDKTTWKNPIPVAVVLLPVSEPKGLVVIRRTIEPGKGKLGLPGGYVDWKETWQQGCAREVMEETGIEIDPTAVTLFDVESSTDATKVIVFGLARPIERAELPAFEATNETGERIVIEEATEMAFSSHTDMVARFFAAQ